MYRSRYDWTPDFRAQEIPLDVTEVMSTSRNWVASFPNPWKRRSSFSRPT